MSETARLGAEFRAPSTARERRRTAELQPETGRAGGDGDEDGEADGGRRAARPLVPVVPQLRRLARNTAVVGLLVIALPVFATATREGPGIVVALLLPIPVALSTTVLWTTLLRRRALPRRPLRRLPAGRAVSTTAHARWGAILQASTVLAVAGLVGVGALSTGPGADFGLLVNAQALGGILVGAAAAVLRASARLRAWEVRNRAQVVTEVGVRGRSWVRLRGPDDADVETPGDAAQR